MSLGKILLFVALLLIGLVGLAMTVCGGGFLLALLRAGNAGNDWFLWAGLALGSLAIGVTILFVIWHAANILAKKET
jgi:hypothetical protein